ncbi:MAG: hypothetical protein HC938_11425 [Nitrospira sp.]|nr:hypothetical protein [Nitrospira sp.]
MYVTVAVKRIGEDIKLNVDSARPLETARIARASGGLRVRLSPGANPAELAGVVRHLEKLSEGERGNVLVDLTLEDGRTVTLKLKHVDFTTHTRAKSLPRADRRQARIRAARSCAGGSLDHTR